MLTITYETTYNEDESETVKVTALVQDGKSCGPYEVTKEYQNVREHEAVSKFLCELKERGQEIHPDPLD